MCVMMARGTKEQKLPFSVFCQCAMGPFLKHTVFFCVVLGKQGSRSCDYFNAKMRGSRRTAKPDRSKPALTRPRAGRRRHGQPKHHHKPTSLTELLKTPINFEATSPVVNRKRIKRSCRENSSRPWQNFACLLFAIWSTECPNAYCHNG